MLLYLSRLWVTKSKRNFTDINDFAIACPPKRSITRIESIKAAEGNKPNRQVIW